MESKRKILVRHRRGDSILSISREFNISRNTIRSIIRSKCDIKSDYVRSIQSNPKLGDYIESLEKMLRDNKYTQRISRTGVVVLRSSHAHVLQYVSRAGYLDE